MQAFSSFHLMVPAWCVCLSNSMSPVFNADIITSGRYHSLLCFLSIILINIKYDAKSTHDFSVLILLPHVCYVAAETSELTSGKHTIIISYKYWFDTACIILHSKIIVRGIHRTSFDLKQVK